MYTDQTINNFPLIFFGLGDLHQLPLVGYPTAAWLAFFHDSKQEGTASCLCKHMNRNTKEFVTLKVIEYQITAAFSPLECYSNVMLCRDTDLHSFQALILF